MVAFSEQDMEDVELEVDDYSRGRPLKRCDLCGDVGATKYMKVCQNVKDG